MDISVTSNKMQRYVYTYSTWRCKGNTWRSVNTWQNLYHISSSHHIAMPKKQLFFQDLILCNSVELFNHHKRIQYLRLPASLCENKLNVYFVWVKYVFSICICVHLHVQCVHFLLKQFLSRISVHILFI